MFMNTPFTMSHLWIAEIFAVSTIVSQRTLYFPADIKDDKKTFCEIFLKTFEIKVGHSDRLPLIVPINHLSTNLLPFSVEIELLLSLLWILGFIQAFSTFRHPQSWLLSFCLLSWGVCIFGIVPFGLSKTRKKWLWERTTWNSFVASTITHRGNIRIVFFNPSKTISVRKATLNALQVPRIFSMFSIHVFFKLGYDIKTSFP